MKCIEACKLFKAEWRIFASIQPKNIVSDNDLSPVACSAPSHHVSQCCHIVNLALRNIFYIKFEISVQENALGNVFCTIAAICPGDNVLRKASSLQTAYSVNTIKWKHFILFQLSRKCPSGPFNNNPFVQILPLPWTGDKELFKSMVALFSAS